MNNISITYGNYNLLQNIQKKQSNKNLIVLKNIDIHQNDIIINLSSDKSVFKNGLDLNIIRSSNLNDFKYLSFDTFSLKIDQVKVFESKINLIINNLEKNNKVSSYCFCELEDNSLEKILIIGWKNKINYNLTEYYSDLDYYSMNNNLYKKDEVN